MANTVGSPRMIAYVVQTSRFAVLEGFGCGNAPDNSILAVLLFDSWIIFAPLLSVVVYLREFDYTTNTSNLKLTLSFALARVARILYRQSRDIDQFLPSNSSITRINYFRIVALNPQYYCGI